MEVHNITGEEILEVDVIPFVLEKALEIEGIKNAIFDVILVDNQYIHQLNRTYRNIDRPTDVITFALEDEKKMVKMEEFRVLGDIYISIDRAREQAIEYGHSLRRELAFLAVHGFYHLLGYDHMTKQEEQEMFQKQDFVLEECKIERR